MASREEEARGKEGATTHRLRALDSRAPAARDPAQRDRPQESRARGEQNQQKESYPAQPAKKPCGKKKQARTRQTPKASGAQPGPQTEGSRRSQPRPETSAEQERPSQAEAKRGTTTADKLSLDPSQNAPGYISELTPHRREIKTNNANAHWRLKMQAASRM